MRPVRLVLCLRASWKPSGGRSTGASPARLTAPRLQARKPASGMRSQPAPEMILLLGGGGFELDYQFRWHPSAILDFDALRLGPLPDRCGVGSASTGRPASARAWPADGGAGGPAGSAEVGCQCLSQPRSSTRSRSGPLRCGNSKYSRPTSLSVSSCSTMAPTAVLHDRDLGYPDRDRTAVPMRSELRDRYQTLPRPGTHGRHQKSRSVVAPHQVHQTPHGDRPPPLPSALPVPGTDPGGVVVTVRWRGWSARWWPGTGRRTAPRTARPSRPVPR